MVPVDEPNPLDSKASVTTAADVVRTKSLRLMKEVSGLKPYRYAHVRLQLSMNRQKLLSLRLFPEQALKSAWRHPGSPSKVSRQMALMRKTTFRRDLTYG